MWPELTQETKPITQLIAGEDYCMVCGQQAEIFQTEGNFCLDCWQGKTMPDVSL